ncbi:hypothetical protein OKE68_11325 [Riemerella anatipestifer]|uniref:Phage major capsid protein n=1 Tax=Riemerella anatipestifer TaxID=34085 RepID=A0A1S7DUD0_RIEAN|nr:hypothetical protein [Riemerella anatipestifer]AQY22668.1 hypothetical protein AB406_1725 [Riemerella anatipestifer]MCU7569351.1 hypothetical protein [Riemerella anatipestifer]MCW0491367.1 hypothetical protein [Riemerella anatipestifer]MCW0524897.1 hypothetical protein [Riemerella anatipestifer]MDY3402465.1 hypothetical protein [Riemerella anatipestifer]
MANKTLKIDQIRNELVRYIGSNPTAIQSAILSDEILLNRYAKTVTKVKGHYPTIQMLMSNVVQIFESKKFTPYGEISFLNKNLKNFHQKIDFELDPAEILGTWLEDMYDESKKADQKSISKTAIEMLKKKIIDDVNILSVVGKYDASKKGVDTPVFGTSMDGLNEIHKNIAKDTDNPAFLIPGDAITQSNILDVVQNYEKGLPSQQRSKIKVLFMNDVDAEDYKLAYEDEYKQSQFQTDSNKTRVGRRTIIGIPNLTQGTIVSTVDNNLLKLIDEIDNPATISDVQIHDRILRVYGEFNLGYDYAINQLVYMHTADGSKNRGLNNREQNELIYPNERGLTA